MYDNMYYQYGSQRQVTEVSLSFLLILSLWSSYKCSSYTILRRELKMLLEISLSFTLSACTTTLHDHVILCLRTTYQQQGISMRVTTG